MNTIIKCPAPCSTGLFKAMQKSYLLEMASTIP